jgi:hypothetical protein
MELYCLFLYRMVHFRDEKKGAVRGKCDESPRRNFAVNVNRNHETTNILSQ